MVFRIHPSKNDAVMQQKNEKQCNCATVLIEIEESKQKQ